MKAKPWAFDGFGLNDGENYADAAWVSVLRRGSVLPVTGAMMVQRQGRWPLVSGLSRPGERLYMHTMLPDVANLWPNRRLLLQALNPEDETPKRLLAADYVPPGCATEDVLLAMGPWDVYADSAGSWHLRDLLDPDNVEADLSGAVHFENGRGDRTKAEFDRALVVEEATTNRVTNPSFETNTTGWTNGGLATFERSTDEVLFGNYSLHILANSASDTAGMFDVSGFTAAATVTVAVWVKASHSTVSLRVRSEPSYDLVGTATHSGSGEWERLEVTGALSAGETMLTILIYESGASGYEDVYIDGVQAEENGYATTYCDGSLGPGYAWSGTEHGSTSTRTVTEVNLDDHASLLDGNMAFTVLCWVRPQYDYDATWPHEYARVFSAYEDSDNGIRIAYRTAPGTDELYAVVESEATTVTLLPDSSTEFSAGDELFIVLTVDFTNDEYVLYLNGVAIASDSTALSVISPLSQMNIGSQYNATSQSGFAFSAVVLLDRAVTAAEITTFYNQGITQARWVEAICERVDPWNPGARPLAFGMVSTLALDGDVRWRSRDGDVAFARLYDDEEDFTITVDSDDEVYPIIRLTPKTAKTSGYAYKRWVAIIWKASTGFTNYPYMLGTVDTAAIVTAGKAQADGDDWRVFVDGVEVDRWFGDSGTSQFNQTATKTWVNLDFQGAIDLTLAAAMLIGDTVTVLDVNEDISGMPSSGILLIDSEAFVYTGKSNSQKRFTGVTRAAKGTSAAGHSADATVSWIQHDVWIMYDDSTASAPTVDDDYKPAFDLGDSTNTSWDYEEFGEDDLLRSGQWTRQATYFYPTFYGGNRGASADPWVELGIRNSWRSDGRIYLYNPCGITDMNFTNGEKYQDDEPTYAYWDASIVSSINGSSWTEEYAIPVPSARDTWESWSRNESLTSGSLYGAMQLDTTLGNHYLEAADCAVTLDSTYTPSHTIGSEQGNYDLSVTIENTTTEESILVEMTMDLDETLEVDTDAKTVTYLADESRQASPTTVEGARRDWLRLVAGENELTIGDSGTQELEIDFVWDRRYFE